ncbi:MAG: hypothetical protein JWL63_1533 [Rhodocyclales bacterium]|nr:hypothetical protein [Rhodocyclales bacterium]
MPFVLNEAAMARGFDVGTWLGRWIEEPQRALGDAAAIDYLANAEGRACLERVLGSMESGAYL